MMIFVLLFLGVLIYLPVRWLGRRNSEKFADSPNVTRHDLLQVLMAVGFFLALAWYMEAGNKIASVAFGLAMFAGNVYLLLVKIRTTKKSNDVDS